MAPLISRPVPFGMGIDLTFVDHHVDRGGVPLKSVGSFASSDIELETLRTSISSFLSEL